MFFKNFTQARNHSFSPVRYRCPSAALKVPNPNIEYAYLLRMFFCWFLYYNLSIEIFIFSCSGAKQLFCPGSVSRSATDSSEMSVNKTQQTTTADKKNKIHFLEICLLAIINVILYRSPKICRPIFLPP